MQRRQLLAGLTGAAGLTAGGVLLADSRTGDASEPAPTETPRDAYATRLAAQGVPATICSEPIPDDPGIYAIDDPAFGRSWADSQIPDRYRSVATDGDLDPAHTVIGLTAGDRHRAYPIELLAHHEVVNDTFGGPTVVTFCPICRSGLVADRVVNGRRLTFAVSGLLWRPERIQVAGAERSNRTFGANRTGGEDPGVRAGGNLVMYDTETVSYWSQILGQAICGRATGARLSIRPSRLTTWGAWQTAHPETDVLLPPPRSGRYVPDDHTGQTPIGTPTDTR